MCLSFNSDLSLASKTEISVTGDQSCIINLHRLHKRCLSDLYERYRKLKVMGVDGSRPD